MASFEADLGSPATTSRSAASSSALRACATSGPGVEVLAEHDGEPVLLRDGRFLVASFHPELTDDTRVHERFLQLVEEERHVGAQQVVVDQAQEGRRRRQARQALLEALARDHRRGQGGRPDPAANLALQNAIEKARAYSMPKDNIERAIAKGSGADADAAAFETVVYEGYGPNGIALLVEALTDNRNRTAAEVRHLFAKHDGNLGATGRSPGCSSGRG